MNKLLAVNMYFNTLTLSVIYGLIFPDYKIFLPFIFSIYSVYVLYYRNKPKFFDIFNVVYIPQVGILTSLIELNFMMMYAIFSICCTINILMWLMSYEKKYQTKILAV